MNIQDLQKNCRNCELCVLSESRSSVCFAVGKFVSNPIMVISYSPTSEEDLTGFCYFGREGSIVKKIMASIDKDVYYTYVIKCWKGLQKINKKCVKTCTENWLFKEIEIIKPSKIICFGKNVSDCFTKKLDYFQSGTYNGLELHLCHSPKTLLDNKKLYDKTIDFIRKI